MPAQAVACLSAVLRRRAFRCECTGLGSGRHNLAKRLVETVSTATANSGRTETTDNEDRRLFRRHGARFARFKRSSHGFSMQGGFDEGAGEGPEAAVMKRGNLEGDSLDNDF